jgi:four helix bundle protein
VTSVTDFRAFPPDNAHWQLTMSVRSYRELVAWKKAIELVTEIYRLTQNFPKHEIYGLTGQLRRAAVSIPSNIAEGQGRLSRGEFKQFLGYARGSVFELDSQVVIARNLGYLDEYGASLLLERIHEVGRILNGLLSSLEMPKGLLATSH